MSQFSDQGLSILLFTSLFANKELVDDRLAAHLASYRHSSQALGGYWDAEIGLAGSRAELGNWLSGRLMGHVEVYQHGDLVWEGFINTIELTYGARLSVRRGPVLDVDNRVKVVYQTETINVTPPIPGMKAETAYANDTDSQALYGILEAILNGGTGAGALMEQKRDSHLAEYAWPESSPENISLPGSGGGLSVTLGLLGYRALLEHFAYNQTADDGQVNTSAKITAVIAAEPNNLLDAWSISSNALQVSAYEDENNQAWAVLKELVNPGDGSDNRYILGVYETRHVYYAQAPTGVGYQLRIAAGQQRLEDGAGVPVWPAQVRPGRWLLLPDLDGGQGGIPPGTPTRQEARLVFVEAVTFTAPGQLDITGSKITRGRQRLTYLGLEGL